METSRTITLFTENRDVSQRSTSFVASVLFHCMGLLLLSFGVMYTPRLDTRAIAKRYTVRNIDLETPEQQRQRAARSKVKYPGPPSRPQQTNAGAGKAAVRPPMLREVAKAPKGPQTLVQPDLPTQIALTKEIPVPTMVIWSPKQSEVKTVVAPQPEKPTAADVKPMPDPPNQSVDLSHLSISTPAEAKPKLLTPPSTTSPIAIHEPDRVQLAPATVSQPTQQPTPAAIMSLSDLKMAEGKITLPPVNESAATDAQGVLAPGPTHEPSAPGDGEKDGNAGPGAGTGAGAASASAPAAESAPPAATPAGAGSSLPSGSDVTASQNGQPSATKITLPKDGQFGAVVVGESLDAQYPELTTVWGGRLAYTVFLHVGLARSWILQYSLSRTDEASAAGTIGRLEAPWPYNIVRPNLAFDAAGGNTIMIHAFVNQSGRFEGLSIVFPPQFPLAQFVLKSLENWQFRPASQNGQPTKVEVLLIIPEQM